MRSNQQANQQQPRLKYSPHNRIILKLFSTFYRIVGVDRPFADRIAAADTDSTCRRNHHTHLVKIDPCRSRQTVAVVAAIVGTGFYMADTVAAGIAAVVAVDTAVVAVDTAAVAVVDRIRLVDHKDFAVAAYRIRPADHHNRLADRRTYSAVV